MSRAVYALRWSAASQTYILSGPQGEEALSITLDSPAWFAWLTERSSFAFQGQEGFYTARLEAVQRGDRYWYAYQRTGQKLSKKYLGKTADLTLARLEQVARFLYGERASDDSGGTALPKQQEQHEPARTIQPGIPPAQKTTDMPATVVTGQMDMPTAMPSDPFHPLLSTRLHAPRPPTRLVHRSRLIERLKSGLSQTLILLSAPAGFGKTTLLAEFLAQHQLHTAWLSLDPEDNDPLCFLSSLLAALQTHDPSLGGGAQALLSSPLGLQGLSLSAVFALLINDLASRDLGEFFLVLDDYHTITLEPIQHAIASLVEHCPPQLHLVIATRSDPRLPLARLRARGQLCELRAADLQFDPAEARSFLHTVLERDLEASTITTILRRTEGWIAGLQLTSLLLQGQRTEAEVRQVLADALGSHRYLVDYLGEEVLSHQPEAVQSFLLHTCILERLSAPLCAAVTGRSVDESVAMLAWLEVANLFLVPLDEGREWYRYHQLWASVLRVLLTRQRGTARMAALYGRASQWYERHDLPAEALEASFHAGEFERAVQLVEQLSLVLLARSQYYTLRRWIEHLPHELWATRPMVCLAYAWTLLLSGALDAYVTPLEEADQLFRRAANRVGVGRADALRALAALIRADGRQTLAYGREALALLPTTDLPLRSVTMSVMGGGYWLTGQMEAASLSLREARTLHERTGNVGSLMFNALLLANVLALEGKLHEAADLYQWVIDSAAERREFAIEAVIRQAALWYEWNSFETLEARLTEAIAESPSLVASTLLARGVLSLAFVIQARIRQARGEHEAASVLFRQAMAQAHRQRHKHLLGLVQIAQVRWWLAQGQVETATRWREEWVRIDDTMPSYEDEPGALTLARVLIAQGEPEESLQLLDGFRAHARAQGRLGSELEVLVLCALAESARGKTGQAVQLLQQALLLAEPESYVRLFVDEGVPMLSLLRLVQSRWKGRRGAGYVRQLLTILEAEHPEQAGQLPSLVVPLSGRERTILRLLAAGRSIAEMAAELVVSPNTIKAQVSSLYRKLNVHSREEALAEAVRLHLL
jgi:LuxR family transcriptional regulator, maltose regulon positive regulatory protein